MKKYQVTANIKGFTAGRVYTQITENTFNVSMKDDSGHVQYVDKKFLSEVM
ncbi:hypothetical protein NVP1210O_73 [Vibrio phage 1.210.O._10N.222.52.C2]|nr:hypothetical protein NVP1210O_73 [Vibrio phage 1.210.O._10N.222.52.C2]